MSALGGFSPSRHETPVEYARGSGYKLAMCVDDGGLLLVTEEVVAVVEAT